MNERGAGCIAFFHAHPDDEVISTGGSIARAAAEGHRVLLIVATNGEHGESPADLADGETLIDRRRAETERSAEVLGAHRIVWLGYRDSGMTGWEQNEHTESFWKTDTEVSAARVAEVLREESVDVLVVYDWHGMYGHPDHVQVHRVGHRAAELAGTTRIFDVTFNRDLLAAGMAEASEEMSFDPNDPMDDGNPMGTPEAELHLAVDVSDYVELKRKALTCHASQVTDTGMLLSMPPDRFAQAFATEWYTEDGAPAGVRPGWLFDDLRPEPAS
jgi:LmbE family N-acetylglucosaminyl deacetylase